LDSFFGGPATTGELRHVQQYPFNGGGESQQRQLFSY
jgi:hypothetical protein